MIDVYLLVNDQLNIPNLMITSNLWKESWHSESDILFLKSIWLSMLGVHATIVYDILHHLIDHLS